MLETYRRPSTLAPQIRKNMPSNSLLVRFFTFAVVLFGICVFRIEATQEGPGFQRVARVSLFQMSSNLYIRI